MEAAVAALSELPQRIVLYRSPERRELNSSSCRELYVGCITRLGCLAVVGAVAVGGGLWWLNGGELPFTIARRAEGVSNPAVTTPPQWVSLSAGKGTGSGTAVKPPDLRELSSTTGSAYMTMSTEQLTSLLASSLSNAIPEVAASTQLALYDGMLHVRTPIRFRDIAGDGAVGGAVGSAISSAIGRTFSDQDTVHFAGDFSIVRPGLAQLEIKKVSVRNIDIPSRLIPLVVRSVGAVNDPKTQQSDSSLQSGFYVPLPTSIGDIRIGDNRVTVYRATTGESVSPTNSRK